MFSKHAGGDDERQMLGELPSRVQILAIFNHCYQYSYLKREKACLKMESFLGHSTYNKIAILGQS